MNYWIIKSEPSEWSLDDQEKNKTTTWDGVRNYQARNNMMQMKVHDICLFYHSLTDKAIVGEVRVIKEYYPDPDNLKFVLIDVEFVRRYSKPVSLKQIKAHDLLQNLPLIKQSRLSVMPISQNEYNIIISMAF